MNYKKAVIKLFNDLSTIASEANYKTIHGKGIPSDLATHLKILTPKQMLQRLPITLAHLVNETPQTYILYIEQNELKKYITIKII